MVVLGPSGSGKTTLLNMIGLLDNPTEGRIALNGRDMTGASRREQFTLGRRARGGWTFQPRSAWWSEIGPLRSRARVQGLSRAMPELLA